MRCAVDRLVPALRAAAAGAWLLVAIQWLTSVTSVGGLSVVDPLLCLATGLAAVTALVGAVRWSGLQRLGYLLLAAGISAYAVGFLLTFYDHDNHVQGLAGINLSDCVSLLLYPLAYGGLSLLAWSRHGQKDRTVILEGAVIGCGVAAVTVSAASWIFPALTVGPAATVVYALAYPVGACTLLAGTLTGLAITGWRADRSWALLIAGFTGMTVGDGAYGIASADHTFRFGTWSELFYLAGPLGVAFAASRRQAPAPVRAVDPRPVMVVSAVATLTALGTLVTATVTAVPFAAVVLAATCGVLAVLRTTLFLQQGRLLTHNQSLARTDALTDLPNRRALLEQLTRAGRNPERWSLVLLDLDNFKDINDTFGHAAGDQMLVSVAKRLADHAAPSVVYRLGGDEFAVLHEGAADTAVALARALRQLGSGWITVDDVKITINASFGVGPLPRDDEDAETATVGEALRRADVALYRAKADRSGVNAWDASLDSALRERVHLANELRAAIAAGGGQLVVHFQPKANAGDGRIVGYEALVRWTHPTRGLIAPLRFLDIAESAGVGPEITQLVLDRALAAAGDLSHHDADVTVAVNVGASDLLGEDLLPLIRSLLDTHRVRPQQLIIEVTESVVLTEPDRMIGVLREVRALGVHVSLDDYGTGLASLGHLRSLPIDELKIDRSLVVDLDTDSKGALIVASTIQLAHGLGLKVVVEGVETASSAALLATMGCDTIQGWLVGRPVPIDQILQTVGPGVPVSRRAPCRPTRDTGLPVARS